MKYKNKEYFFISLEKEMKDIDSLVCRMSDEKWLDSSTVLVNCSPDYTSITCQILNHKLSFLNKNDLFEMVNLQMPYPIMSQVWNPESQEYETYEHYLQKWTTTYLRTDLKYLFIDSGTLRGVNFTKLDAYVKRKLDRQNYRFATLYLQDDSKFEPDYYIQKFNKKDQGGLLFWWENADNPNWDY